MSRCDTDAGDGVPYHSDSLPASTVSRGVSAPGFGVKKAGGGRAFDKKPPAGAGGHRVPRRPVVHAEWRCIACRMVERARPMPRSRRASADTCRDGLFDVRSASSEGLQHVRQRKAAHARLVLAAAPPRFRAGILVWCMRRGPLVRAATCPWVKIRQPTSCMGRTRGDGSVRPDCSKWATTSSTTRARSA